MSKHPSRPSLPVILGALACCLVGCGGGGGGGGVTGSDPEGAARLASRVSSVGAMSPVFESETTRYALWTGDQIASVLFTPTPVAPGATITDNGGPAGTPLPVAGLGLLIEIVVRSPDGVTTATYTVEVLRVSTRDLIDPTPPRG